MRLSAVLLAIAFLIGLTAIADHRWKQRRMNQAEVGEWYCAHIGTRCGGVSSAGIERHWNERQLGYEIVVSVIGAAGVVVAVLRARRR